MRSRPAHRLQRVGLAAGPVEGDHQVGAQPLAKGMLGDEGAHLADEVGVPPAGQLGGKRSSTASRRSSSSRAISCWAKSSKRCSARASPRQSDSAAWRSAAACSSVVALERDAGPCEEGLEPSRIDGQRVDVERIAGRPVLNADSSPSR